MSKKPKKSTREKILGTGQAGKAAASVKGHQETMAERIARETGIKGTRWGK